MWERIVFCYLLSLPVVAVAGSEILSGTTTGVDFGGAALAGAGRIIHAYSIPVITGASTVYYNVDIDVDIVNGVLIGQIVSALPASGPAITASSGLDNFQIGTYKSIASGNLYSLTGPSIGAVNRRIWSLVPASGSAATYSATFSTGPARGNPVISAGSWTSADYTAATEGPSYGIDNANCPISATQVGNSITLKIYCALGGLTNIGVSYGSAQTVTFVKQ